MDDTTVAPEKQPTLYQLAILTGLQKLAHVYGGTARELVVYRRRAKNRVARRSRRVNRGGAR